MTVYYQSADNGARFLLWINPLSPRRPDGITAGETTQGEYYMYNCYMYNSNVLSSFRELIVVCRLLSISADYSLCDSVVASLTVADLNFIEKRINARKCSIFKNKISKFSTAPSQTSPLARRGTHCPHAHAPCCLRRLDLSPTLRKS